MIKQYYRLAAQLGYSGSLFLFAVVCISNLYNALFPSHFYLDDRMLKEDHKILYLTLGLLLGLIAAISKQKLYSYKSMRPPLISKVSFAYLLIAVFITFSYRIIFTVQGIASYLLFGVGVFLFYKLMTFIMPLYFDPNKETHQNKPSADYSSTATFTILFAICSSLIFLVSLLVTGKILYNNIPQQVFRQRHLREGFYVKSIAPSTTTHAQVITINGYNFGWRIDDDKRYRVMSKDGELSQVSEWTETKITLTVPLHLQPGKKELWVVKPHLDEHGKSIKSLNSNKRVLTVLSRFDFYPEAGDTKLERGLKKASRLVFAYALKVKEYYINL